MGADDRRLLYVHILRTGGTTFVAGLRAVVPTTSIWPGPGRDVDRPVASSTIDGVAEAGRNSATVITSTGPFAAREVLGADVACITMLRHPVYRTLSILRWCQHHVDSLEHLPLEAIYDRPWINERLVHEHQTRVLSMTLSEASSDATDQPTMAVDHDSLARSVWGSSAAALARPSPVDEARFDRARANLQSCAVVGVTNHLEEFVATVNETFGLSVRPTGHLRASPPTPPVSDAFKDRIAADNPLDMRLFSLATHLARHGATGHARRPSAPRSEPAPPTPSGHYLFLHIMKTAGTTFTGELRRHFPPATVFPTTPPSDLQSIERALSLSILTAQRAAFWAAPAAVYCAHLPFVARDLLGDRGDNPTGEPPVCLTALRDPVARTLSFLGHCQRSHPELRDRSLESIYEDPWLFDRLIHDHQTRVFSITAAEAAVPTGFVEVLPEAATELLPASASAQSRQRVRELVTAGDRAGFLAVLDDHGVDVELASLELGVLASRALGYSEVAASYLLADAAMARPSPVDGLRLAAATANLERCEVVGLTDDYAGLIDDVNRLLGFRCSPTGWANRGTPTDHHQPASFIRRIEDDNRYDMELVATARDLVAYRRGA